VERLERLVNLVVALLDTRRPLTREELRERVGGYSSDDDNFRRNFERDKELLREIGIPVVTEPVDPRAPESTTGYRVPRDLYELPDPGLDEEELRALGAAASTVAVAGAGAGTATSALWKVAAASVGGDGPGLAPPGPAPGPGGAHPGPVVDVAAGPAAIALFSAVSERRVARFTYNGVARRVDPYRLSYRQGRWYLSGFDHGRGGERLFRVDRVTGPVEVEGPPGAFERPLGGLVGPPPPWRLGEDEEVVVDLRVDASQAEWVSSVLGEEAVAERATDGSVRLKLAVTNRAALRTFVLGLLDHAEVLGPPEVRDELVEWLSMLAGAPQ